jgi:hypothetical protein
MMKLPQWNPFYSTQMFGALKYLVIAWPFYSSANIAILKIGIRERIAHFNLL